jgi:Protein of unknown function (DUF1569)
MNSFFIPPFFQNRILRLFYCRLFYKIESGTLTMDPYLHRLQESIASSALGVSGEDLVRHQDGKWSVAEILEHLYLTYTATVKGCERCLGTDSMPASPDLTQRLFTLVVVGFGHMPKGRQALKQNSPRGMPAEEVVSHIGPQITLLDVALTRCEERYGTGTRFMNHPILGPLTVAQWRKFHWVHGRHHIQQVLRLRELWAQKEKAPGLPGA